jgi:hypothetical protein
VRRPLIVLLLALLCLTRSALAQGLPPPILGDPGDPYLLDVPYSVPPLDALGVTFERGWTNQYLLTRGLLSDLNASFAIRAPRLYYRDRGVAVSAGTQMLYNASPFLNQTSYTGGRLSGVTRRFGWTVWGGHIENLDQELTSGITLDRQMAGAAFGYRPNAYTSFNASGMGYASRDGGPIDRTVGTVAAFGSDRRYYSIDAAYARDLGAAALPGETSSTRSAWQLDAQYSRHRLTASVFALSYGRLFGPPQGLTDLRGQHNVNALLQYQLSSRLALVESYVNNGQESAGVATGPMAINTNLQHRLMWTPLPGVNLQAGLQQTSLSSGTGSTNRTSGLFLQAGGAAGIFTLFGDARSEALAAGARNGQMHLRVGVPLSPTDGVFLDNTYFSTSSPGAPSTNILQAGVGYSRSFDDERGVATIQYSRQFPIGVGPDTSLIRNTTISLAYRPFGRLWVGGSLNMSTGTLPG